MAAQQHVFVYGTLRPAVAAGEPRFLIEGLKHDGPATVRGRLVDLGDYPGLVEGSGLVHGDLLVVEDSEKLAALDAYEECGPPSFLYRRELVTAERPDGSHLGVWVYRYRRDVDPAADIPGGDYVKHIRSDGCTSQRASE